MRARIAAAGMTVTAAIGVGAGLVIGRYTGETGLENRCEQVLLDFEQLGEDAIAARDAAEAADSEHMRSIGDGELPGSGNVVRAKEEAARTMRVWSQLIVQNPDCFPPADVAEAAEFLDH